jgi:hypothetical protein
LAKVSQANGAKSKGPITPEGKARSSQNAIKTGLHVQPTTAAPGEPPTAFDQIRQGMMENLQPEDGVQAALVDRMAVCTWRLRRALDIETAVFAERQYTDPLGKTTFQNYATQQTLAQVNRYETSIERSLQRTLKIFLDLKAAGKHSQNIKNA